VTVRAAGGADRHADRQVSSEVGGTERAYASDSSVSSGGARCPRSSIEM